MAEGKAWTGLQGGPQTPEWQGNNTNINNNKNNNKRSSGAEMQCEIWCVKSMKIHCLECFKASGLGQLGDFLFLWNL